MIVRQHHPSVRCSRRFLWGLGVVLCLAPLACGEGGDGGAGETGGGSAMAVAEPPAPNGALPDRDLEPIVVDVADSRLAERLVLPDTDDVRTEFLVGVLQQTAVRPGPPGSGIATVEEWFIERADGEMIAIAVPRTAGRSSAPPTPRRGTRVEVRGLRIGTLEAVSRDERTRRWPLFVGRPIVASPMSTGAAAIIAATLLAAGGWYVLRRRLAARHRRSIREVLGSADRPHATAVEPPMDLPADPAEALDVLAARADDSETDA